jgi:hypothetical protein
LKTIDLFAEFEENSVETLLKDGFRVVKEHEQAKKRYWMHGVWIDNRLVAAMWNNGSFFCFLCEKDNQRLGFRPFELEDKFSMHNLTRRIDTDKELWHHVMFDHKIHPSLNGWSKYKLVEAYGNRREEEIKW